MFQNKLYDKIYDILISHKYRPLETAIDKRLVKNDKA